MNSTYARCRKIREDDLEMVMNWRMLQEVTKYMLTDPVLTIEGQRKWFEKIKEQYNKPIYERESFHWILEVDEVPVGVVSMIGWDKNNSIIHTGEYLAVKEKSSIKFIIDLHYSMNEFAFDTLGVNKIAFEIMSNNKGVMRLNKRFGAHEDGVMRQEVFKYGEYLDLHLFSILKNEWNELKNKTKYDKIEFEI